MRAPRAAIRYLLRPTHHQHDRVAAVGLAHAVRALWRALAEELIVPQALYGAQPSHEVSREADRGRACPPEEHDPEPRGLLQSCAQLRGLDNCLLCVWV